MLTTGETEEYSGAKALRAGEIVYQDEDYTVFVYENAGELMSMRQDASSSLR